MEVYEENLYTIINQTIPEPITELIKLLKTLSIKYNTRIIDYTIITSHNEYNNPTDELIDPKSLIQYLNSLFPNKQNKAKYGLKLLILNREPTLSTVHSEGYDDGLRVGFSLNRKTGYDEGLNEGLLLMNKLEKPGVLVPNELREYVYRRDDGVCQACGKKLKYGTKDCTIDHIIPRELGGSSLDTRNLQLLCKTCNNMKGSRVMSNSSIRQERGRKL